MGDQYLVVVCLPLFDYTLGWGFVGAGPVPIIAAWGGVVGVKLSIGYG